MSCGRPTGRTGASEALLYEKHVLYALHLIVTHRRTVKTMTQHVIVKITIPPSPPPKDDHAMTQYCQFWLLITT